MYTAEHNSVLKLLKDGKLSEKPYAGGKNDIWAKLCLSYSFKLFTSDDCTSIMSFFWDIIYSKLTSSLLIQYIIIS